MFIKGTLHIKAVSYTHLRAHETKANLVCRLLLEKKKKKKKKNKKQKKDYEILRKQEYKYKQNIHINDNIYK